MTDNVYSAPESNLTVNAAPLTASTRLKVIAFVLAAGLIILGGFQQFIATGGRIPETLGGAVGGVFWPFLVLALFQLGKGYRNERSRYKVFAVTAFIFFVLRLLSFISVIFSMLML